MSEQPITLRSQVNLVGLSKSDYRGNPSTLCQGCGHNSISSQIIAACYELTLYRRTWLNLVGLAVRVRAPRIF